MIGGTSEGTVVVKTGGKVRLFNKGNNKSYGVGKVPVGNYELQIDFGGMGYAVQGNIGIFSVKAGSVVQIECDDNFGICKRTK